MVNNIKYLFGKLANFVILYRVEHTAFNFLPWSKLNEYKDQDGQQTIN